MPNTTRAPREGALQSSAGSHTSDVEGGDGHDQDQTKHQFGQVDGVFADPVKWKRLQRGEDLGRQLPDGNRLVRADDQIAQRHHPADDETHAGGKQRFGVGHLTVGAGDAGREMAVNDANGDNENAPQDEPECRPGRAAPAEPVVHHHDPANADHRPQRQGEERCHPQTLAERCSRTRFGFFTHDNSTPST